MKKLYVITLIIANILTGNFLWTQSDNRSDTIEGVVDNYIAPLQKYDLFSGAILIIKNGETYVNKGYGLANQEHQLKNTPNTKFRIASLSKIFTKLAIIQLSEKKVISLNDNLSRFIPDYPRGKEISVLDLLNHSSGITHLNDFPDYDQLAKERYTVEGIIDLFKDRPLDFEPGASESYSNSGYVLLVHIIERVTGLKYGAYLEKHIFQPAGMKNTGHESGTQIIDNLAKGYMMNLEGKGLQLPLYYNPSIKIGGGSLYSTTWDLYLFNQAYKSGKLSDTTEPLYNQGTYGKSPGYNASIWEMNDVFMTVLSNNYSTPIRRVTLDLTNIMLGRPYKTLEINEDSSITTEELIEYEGDFKIGDDIETIERVNNVLIEYENGDKWRGCRLIPIGKDIFFDTCYLEKLTFTRNLESGVITGFIWESGDKTIRVTEAKGE